MATPVRAAPGQRGYVKCVEDKVMIFNALKKCLWVDSTKGEAAFN